MPTPPTALIAEDEPHIRQLFKSLLLSMGVDVAAEADDGRKAVELFHSHRPDMVFLDFNMPQKSGLETLREIRALAPDVFVVMVSAVADAQSVNQCLDAGAAHFLLKDTSLPEMQEIIAEAWRYFNTPLEEC